MAILFLIFWIRSVHNGSNLIKLDQIGFSRQSKNVTMKSCHIFRKDKNGCFVFDFFGSYLPEMDQAWSNWISDQSKNVTVKSCHIYRKDKNGSFVFDLCCLDLSKMQQTWLIKSPIKKCYYKNCQNYREDNIDCFVCDFFGSDLSKIRCPKWIKLDQIGFLTNQNMLL